jgi:hypothetical protein
MEGDAMYFLNTKMHMVTFSIAMFETVMLFFQVIYFLQRTSDKKRLLYLILLVFLILYNVCSDLFPDEQFIIPVMLQNVIAYMVGFTMSMYFVYHFYKAFDLKNLKFSPLTDCLFSFCFRFCCCLSSHTMSLAIWT